MMDPQVKLKCSTLLCWQKIHIQRIFLQWPGGGNLRKSAAENLADTGTASFLSQSLRLEFKDTEGGSAAFEAGDTQEAW
jgi:hypothetical protein